MTSTSALPVAVSSPKEEVSPAAVNVTLQSPVRVIDPKDPVNKVPAGSTVGAIDIATDPVLASSSGSEAATTVIVASAVT